MTRSGKKGSGKSELVLLAVRYIKNHCLESLRLETVAEETGSQPNYLSTIIRRNGDHIPAAYDPGKVKYSKKLLDDTRMTIDEISIAVGYENYISFYNAFRKMCI